MRKTFLPVLVLVWCALVAVAGAQEVNYYDLLSTDAVGAREFIRSHPEWDGRGTVVAVLDTGVDMSVAGLQKTTTGAVKVIEARDFSGQGVVHLRSPRRGKEGREPVWSTGTGVVRGVEKLQPRPEEDGLLLGFLEESRFVNSAVPDVNDNGKRDDKFAVLMGRIERDGKKDWGVWVDTDADGQLDDEETQEEFSRNQKHFFFVRTGTGTPNKTMAVALHLVPRRKEVVFHFADGSHGTHVAGIAAGHSLFGKKGFDGIAPGAQVMSLKIGDNTLSGGSTTTESMKKALEFAGSWSRTHKTPVVVNMSYGIGSETEGTSDIDRVTDEILRKYPLLSVSTSAGNSGPGLSTVGTPAGAHLAFSTGALLTRRNARSLYAAKIARDVIFYFSSRGGELAKPDGLAPGAAASTVPPWENWVVMRGTSMASPQTAGCLALLASAAVQQKEPPVFNGGLLTRALRNSGRPLDDYVLPDQGAGVVHVPSAWESLKRLTRRKNAGLVAGYRVEGECPTCPDAKAPAAYFRAGTYIPKKPHAVSFSIRPTFMRDVAKEERKGYFEAFDLSVVGANWLEPTAKAVFFNGDGSVSVDAFFDPDKLKEPGVHSALIRGTPRELGRGKENALFELWATVIVPEVFDLTKGFVRRWRGEKLAPGEVRRYFLRVPEGSASLRVKLSPVDGSYTQSRLTLFDPDGHEFQVKGPYADSTRQSEAEVIIDKNELRPGIWEVVVMTHYVARDTSRYDLEVEFSGFHYQAPEEVYYEMGSPPRAVFQLRSLFDKVFEGRGRGGLYGYYRKQEYGSKSDRITVPITLEADVSVLKLRFHVSREVYKRFTDCAINILDHRGAAVERGGLSSLNTVLEIRNPTAGVEDTTYTLEILAGFAEHTDKRWSVEVEEFHALGDYIPAKIWCDGYSYFTLYPNVEYGCEFELQEKPTITPSGYKYYGELQFRNARTKEVDLVIPLRVRVGE